jgi:hypothetical protein
MNTYTAMCFDKEDSDIGRISGTIWRGIVTGETLEDAMLRARRACAYDWSCKDEQIDVLLMIVGTPSIPYFHDDH